jgi:NAD-dependent SIR2 family protein deacetylase
MFYRSSITKPNVSYGESIKRLREEIKLADTVIIGAGAGLSTSAGFTYSGERFEKYFSDFEKKYGFHDMYSGGFYPFKTPEEQWAYWSRFVFVNRYSDEGNDTYEKLYEIVKNKDYFVLTTNVDHKFQKAGFEKNRLFYTQGDYGLFQCSVPCHSKTYDNEQVITEMVWRLDNMKIPTELIPKCPICGKPMAMNLRSDDRFVQDSGWYAANRRYNEFLSNHEYGKILFLELGVGFNTPGIVKYPFWKMTAENPNAVYACINYGEAVCIRDIADRAVCIDRDIKKVLDEISE